MRRAGSLAAAIVGCLFVASPVQACTLRLGWEYFEPFQVKRDGEVTGLDVTLFREAAAIARCTVETYELPWARMLRALELGRMDVALGASFTPDRAAYARFTQPYRREEFVIFMRQGELERLGPGGLLDIAQAGLRLGTGTGYTYGALFDEAMKDPAFVQLLDEAARTQLNVRKLISGRIDAFLDSRFVGWNMAKREGVASSIEIHPAVVSFDPVHFMLSKTSVSEEIFNRIDHALGMIQANGRLNMILAQYLQ